MTTKLQIIPANQDKPFVLVIDYNEDLVNRAEAMLAMAKMNGAPFSMAAPGGYLFDKNTFSNATVIGCDEFGSVSDSSLFAKYFMRVTPESQVTITALEQSGKFIACFNLEQLI